jgi:PTS system nitrogen regulatory IIA component
MGVLDILTADHVSVSSQEEGLVSSKADALRRLAALLAKGTTDIAADEIERVLTERERLQSTGVGGGVAIPHGGIDRLKRQVGALLICPKPIEFDAIDGAPVSILFAVIGPKGATGEHLKMLARVSRLLRDDGFRERLLQAPNGMAVFYLIAAEERKGSSP